MSSKLQSDRPKESTQELRERIQELEIRLREAEETLAALRNGEVDAVIASGPEGDCVYTLKGADQSYRMFLQEMAEGALTLMPDGLIVFSNERFASLLGVPMERVIGSRIQDFTDESNAKALSELLGRAQTGTQKQEVEISSASGERIPVYVAVNRFQQEALDCVCVVVTNLSEQKRTEQIIASEKLARALLAERERAGQVLAESEYRLRMAADVSGFYAYEWDPATGALSWDPRIKTMWGLSADESVDYALFLAAIHPEDRPRVEEKIARSRRRRIF
jgi:PAS domain S-box-containing protein